MSVSEVDAQRQYHTDAADRYDEMRGADADEDYRGLDRLSDIIGQQQMTPILEIVAPGRGLPYLKNCHDIRDVGVEPVAAQREKDCGKGLSREELIDGNALILALQDDGVDFGCAFGALHHIKDHRRVVSKTCWVAKTGIFSSGSHTFGEGSAVDRALKPTISVLELWQSFNLGMARGKGCNHFQGDRMFYSHSVFGEVPVVRKTFPALRSVTTTGSTGPNLYRQPPHITLFAGQ